MITVFVDKYIKTEISKLHTDQLGSDEGMHVSRAMISGRLWQCDVVDFHIGIFFTQWTLPTIERLALYVIYTGAFDFVFFFYAGIQGFSG